MRRRDPPRPAAGGRASVAWALPFCGMCLARRPRHAGSALASRLRAGAAARRGSLFGRDDRAGAARGRGRRLRGLPWRPAGRARLRGGAGHRDAVRHGLRQQHLARPRVRHRDLVLSGLRTRHATGDQPRRPPPLPGPSLSEFRQGRRGRSRSPLCLPDGGTGRLAGGAARGVALPLLVPPLDGGVERAVPQGGGDRTGPRAVRPVEPRPQPRRGSRSLQCLSQSAQPLRCRAGGGRASRRRHGGRLARPLADRDLAGATPLDI